MPVLRADKNRDCVNIVQVDGEIEPAIDLSQDTITPNVVMKGYMGHLANGKRFVGEMELHHSYEEIVYVTAEKWKTVNHNLGFKAVTVNILTDLDNPEGATPVYAQTDLIDENNVRIYFNNSMFVKIIVTF